VVGLVNRLTTVSVHESRRVKDALADKYEKYVILDRLVAMSSPIPTLDNHLAGFSSRRKFEGSNFSAEGGNG